MAHASAYLKKILQEQSDEKELAWVEEQEEKLPEAHQMRSFYLAFSSAPRVIGKTDLRLTQVVTEEAGRIRKGFQLENWNLLQCARTYLLLLIRSVDEEIYNLTLTKLHEAADVDEQVTLYSALPLLPYPQLLTKRAAEGIRTNITNVFDAIALNNPYPHDFLDEPAWNQMVLKAVFMQRPLYRIYGAEERANPELAKMLIDFAHERWAANRGVLPELWRFVGPFLNEKTFADIEKVVQGEPLERKAGFLACSMSSLSEAQELLDQNQEVRREIESGSLNWNVIGFEAQDHLLRS